ncbi:tRNA-specific adenosine deaminase [Candidatus Kinetoplastibacterium sorsogonicusi]|uniref:tRNA-specific adenosine deaminase n=1 Tax=Candidatus Kinetoplastidibacterium kentomonadis TaxID=1576550 RepID=A0A3Q8EY33_9PROT|nr:tRNA adenosine(34) deaminase TadA [Candidatus Kinetoplastibacterium sorsogonicusi]AWD32371.1 tRNA-specific adenosine deaminase [Candidatus Kinetoplastibacterium sorsogonicusi]
MVDDNYLMLFALQQAEIAEQLGEIPVGAIITDSNGMIISKGYNRTIIDNDPTAHAEVVAIRNAAKQISNYRLNNLNIYVTLEPCLMCIGALFHSRIESIFFGAYDYKTGACGSVINAISLKKLNHHATSKGGILSCKCSEILINFFKSLRKNKKYIK